jgi:hypothetical protein
MAWLTHAHFPPLLYRRLARTRLGGGFGGGIHDLGRPPAPDSPRNNHDEECDFQQPAWTWNSEVTLNFRSK